jgi:hypothetical protein
MLEPRLASTFDNLNMEETSSTAVVEPKQKSQEPAAKARRLKRLRTNPDFAEAVSEERAAAKFWKDEHDNLHREYMVEMEDQGKWQDKAVANITLQLDYIEQFKENKGLNKVIETQNSTIRSQDEVIALHQRSINALKGILELDKKARNPNRVIGRKRGRPQGSKSKAVAFGAEAMPDNDLVTFGSTEEFEATLM